jgi:hypothetical protein
MSRRSWIILGFVLVAVFVAAIAALGAGDKRQEWAKSGHANRELTQEATVEARGVTAAHCGRCHSEQGFKAWLPQLIRGNSGMIVAPDGSPATVPYLASLGLTKFSVRPQTCTTCHNDDYSLRVRGDTAVLPAGFQARAVGAGALCMTCHNTRNGRIQWNAQDAGRFTAPHVAAQADVIMGKNVFFVDYGENFVSPHAAFTGNACATCHLKLNPTGHTFKAQKTVCTNCHGSSFNAVFVQEPIEELIEDLGKAISFRIMQQKARISTIASWNPKTDQTTENFAVDSSAITGVELTEIHGQIGLKFALTGGRELYSQLGSVKDASGAPTISTRDVIVKAAWNYFLFHSDGSEGVHNPRFARTVLGATLEALK